jgi:FkbM family methyltransferase
VTAIAADQQPGDSRGTPSTSQRGENVLDRLRSAAAATGGRARHTGRLARLLVDGPEGRSRARRRVALRLLRGDADSLTFSRTGTVWTIPISDLVVSAELFETGGFQRGQLEGLVRWLEANDQRWSDAELILDIGANIGTSTIPFAVETGRRILAVEPDPSNFKFLQTNVAANHLEARVSCRQVAVSDRAGRVEMVVDPASAGSTEILEAGMTYEPGTVIEVDARTLDDLLHEEGISPNQIALVWSDTEGFERQVIESGRSLWSSGTPLYVEIWHPGLMRHGGMEQLTTAVMENFETMVASEDLQSRAARAAARPVAEFAEYIRTLGHDTDVLLIPARRR